MDILYIHKSGRQREVLLLRPGCLVPWIQHVYIIEANDGSTTKKRTRGPRRWTHSAPWSTRSSASSPRPTSQNSTLLLPSRCGVQDRLLVLVHHRMSSLRWWSFDCAVAEPLSGLYLWRTCDSRMTEVRLVFAGSPALESLELPCRGGVARIEVRSRRMRDERIGDWWAGLLVPWRLPRCWFRLLVRRRCTCGVTSPDGVEIGWGLVEISQQSVWLLHMAAQLGFDWNINLAVERVLAGEKFWLASKLNDLATSNFYSR